MSYEKDQLFEEDALPLYYQLINIIKRDIENGSLKPGDKMPSEQALCEKYSVSRITVRQAMLSLVGEGLFYRKQGKGTFVTKPKLPRNINNLYNFSASMKDLHILPTSKVLEQKVIDAPVLIIRYLHLEEKDSKIIKLVRVRLANDEPIMIETSYIPYNLAPSIATEDMGHNSIYGLFMLRYRLRITNAEETYEAVLINKKQAKLLHCNPLSPGFFIERIAFLENEIPVEYSNSTVCADRCRLVTKLQQKQTTFERKIIPVMKGAD